MLREKLKWQVVGLLLVGIIAVVGLSQARFAGQTDGDGRFSLILFPGTTVTGRLTECKQQQPISHQTFTLYPVHKDEAKLAIEWVPGGLHAEEEEEPLPSEPLLKLSVTGPGELGGFGLLVPGYEPVVITHLSTFSMLGLTNFLLGDQCLNVQATELPWSANRPLTWDDFQGDPPEGAEDGDEAAKIVMWLGYSFKTRAWFDKGAGKWKAHLTEVTTTNTMDRSQSWVVPGKKTPALLGHEQKHFDLNEVYRRLLDAALQKLVCSLEATGDTEEEAEENLDKKLKETFDKVNKKCDEVQEQYDKETDHGRNADKQKEWDKKVADWLADPSTAPQP